MSVALFSNEEIGALWAELGTSAPIGEDLFYLAVANRAAYMATYGEPVEPVKISKTPTPTGVPTWARSRKTWVENLLYNCVTNAGVDFAPPEIAARVLAAATPLETNR